MKLLLLIALTCNLLLAFPFELHTLKADFKQSILDDHNKSIHYSGHLIAKRPALAHWVYSAPISKEIFVNRSEVTIIEPDLEQVILKDIGDTIDIIAIVKASQKVSETHYVATYRNKDYHITLQKQTLHSIAYDDDFGNATTIVFENVVQNGSIEAAALTPVIPEGFDLIR